LTDTTGALCGVGQSGPVWFLAREDYLLASTGFPTAFIERNCSVPVGKAIYIPLANTFWAPPEDSAFLDAAGWMPGAGLVERLRAATHYVLDHSHDLSLTIDGTPVRNLASYRVVTQGLSLDFPAGSFQVTPPMYYATGIYSPIVAGGYGVILAPPSPGPHEIHVHLEFTYNTANDPLFGFTDFHYEADIVYHLNVVN
jgi:hypothetical protein